MAGIFNINIENPVGSGTFAWTGQTYTETNWTVLYFIASLEQLSGQTFIAVQQSGTALTPPASVGNPPPQVIAQAKTAIANGIALPPAAPGAISNLTAGVVTATTVPLTWTAPSSGSLPITYLIEYRTPSGSGSYTTFASGVSGTSTTVTGLSSNASYDFRVTPSNFVGSGPQTVLSNITTTAVPYDFNFATQTYTGPSGTISPDPFSAGFLTLTRASTKLAPNAAGSYSSFSSGVAAITTAGLSIEDSANNYYNTQNTGAVVGTPGTLPTGWVATLVGLSSQVVGFGANDPTTNLPYIDIRFYGTTTGTGLGLIFGSNSLMPLSSGQIAVGSCWMSLQSQTTLPALTQLFLQTVPITSSGTNAGNTSQVPLYLSDTTPRRLQTPGVAGTSTAAHRKTVFTATLINGTAYDFTIRFSMPQCELVPTLTSRASSPIPSTGSIMTRAADAIVASGALLTTLEGSGVQVDAFMGGRTYVPSYPALVAPSTASPGLNSIPQPTMASETIPLLGINGTTVALQRESNGSVSCFTQAAQTAQAMLTNYVKTQKLTTSWNSTTVQVAGTGGGDYANATATVGTITSVQIGAANGNSMRGPLARLTVTPTYNSNLSAVANINVQYAVYAAKPSGIGAAYRAAYEGITTAIIGDWRELTVGGMMAGGLGFTDITTYASSTYGGIPRWVISRINQKYNRTDNTFYFEPRFARAVFEDMLAELGIPVYWSGGFPTVTTAPGVTSGDYAVTGFSTASRTIPIGASNYTVVAKNITASYYNDASYEGDFIQAAGVTTFYGREANSVYSEVHNGYTGTPSGSSINTNSGGFQYGLQSGPHVDVDPYVTVGTPSSGLLSGSGFTTTPALAQGAADTLAQSFCFRGTMIRSGARMIPIFPSGASTNPATFGFNAANYESFIRNIAGCVAVAAANGRTFTAGAASSNTSGQWGIADLIAPKGGLEPSSVVYDVNNQGGVSVDFVGDSVAYLTASGYSNREAQWIAQQNWFYGMWWVLQGYYSDPSNRVPSALITEALLWGFDVLHYQDNVLDQAGFSPQLYVREPARMVRSSYTAWNETDIAPLSSVTTPRNTDILAAGSYAVDTSHTARRIGVQNTVTGNYASYNEGIEFFPTGSSIVFPGVGTGKVAGNNGFLGVPRETMISDRNIANNLSVSYAGAFSHVAFGFFRMELTGMAVGEGCGAMVAMAVATGAGTALQDLTYGTSSTAGTLRYRLFNNTPAASPVAPNPTTPVSTPVAPLTQ